MKRIKNVVRKDLDSCDLGNQAQGKNLTQKIRSVVFQHIYENALCKNIYIDCVGGYNDHVHCLFRIRNDQVVNEVLRLLKGESSRWINKTNLTRGKFEWQKEYLALSVSESQIDRVRMYIRNQETHHGGKSSADEYAQFIRRLGLRVKGLSHSPSIQKTQH